MKKICQNCKKEFESKIEVDGKIRNLQNRKYCLNCSLFGEHNTSQLDKYQKGHKICYGCKKELKLSDFNKKGKWLHSKCKKCLYRYQMDRWIARKKKAIDERGGCCSKCGYNKNYASLVFHHLDPNEKEFSWIKLRLKSWDKINKELDKCIILCANCHGEEHYPELKKE